MMRKLCVVLFAVCVLAISANVSAFGQMPESEVKEKPRMYTYVAFWAVPRAQWGEKKKLNSDDRVMLDKDLAAGNIIAYGDDMNLVHQADGFSHDDWFSAMSMAGLMAVLDKEYKSPNLTAPAQANSTKHADEILVSRYYNWHPGALKDAYSYTSQYTLKPTASSDALETLSKTLFVPVFEKALADGVISEYEIDSEAVHSDSPDNFYLSYITQNAEGLDKMTAAIRERVKANPFIGPAVDSMVDFEKHRDYLVRTDAVYK
jgi:hypothetical protein